MHKKANNVTMASKAISMHRAPRLNSRKDVPKPELRRSTDFAYENLLCGAAEASPSAHSFEDPVWSLSATPTHDPFLQLSWNANEASAAWGCDHSISANTLDWSLGSSVSHDKPWQLDVAKIVSGDDAKHAKPTNMENDPDRLDYPLGVANTESTDQDKESVAPSKWTTFGQPFPPKESSGSSQACDSFFLKNLDHTDDAEKSSGANVGSRPILKLEEQVASLEWIVCDMERNANTKRAVHSPCLTPFGQTNTVIIEGIELLRYKSAAYNIAHTYGNMTVGKDIGEFCPEDTGKNSKRSKLSVRRMIRSRFFDRKCMKYTLVEE